MDLRPSFEQQQLRDTLRRLLEVRLTAHVDRLPDPPVHDPRQALDDALTVGLLGLGVAEHLGGAGGLADLAVAHEELGRGLAPPLLTSLSLATRLLRHVSGAAADALLADLAAGRVLAAPAVEDAHGATTTLSPAGGQTGLGGRKQRVVAGRDCDELLVTAIDSSADVVLVRVATGSPGVAWSPEREVTDAAQWTVDLTAVKVPEDAVLARGARPALQRYRTEAVVLAAARQLGGGRAVLDRTVEHVRTREQFDRPIGTFQAVQHQLADVATELDATSLAVAQAAWALDAAALDDAATDERATRLAAIAGLAAQAAFRRATLVAHQLHGGMGFVLDSPLHLWSARAIADPTIPLARRTLLDVLADAGGVRADDVATPPDHRSAAAPGTAAG